VAISRSLSRCPVVSGALAAPLHALWAYKDGITQRELGVSG
jgi:hypothetical protein